jgi:hypothetical protein
MSDVGVDEGVFRESRRVRASGARHADDTIALAGK